VSFGQTFIGKKLVGQTSLRQASFGQTFIGQTFFGQTSLRQASFGQTTIGQKLHQRSTDCLSEIEQSLSHNNFLAAI
jgi:hypothetical protein